MGSPNALVDYVQITVRGSKKINNKNQEKKNEEAFKPKLLTEERRKKKILQFSFLSKAVAQLVEALCYKPEGSGFDSQ
jgi:hypothetical protein